MNAPTLTDLAEGLNSLSDDPSITVEVTGTVVLVTRDGVDECEVSVRDGMIDITIPLFAFSKDAAATIADWALDLNLRNPERGRIALHRTAPVLLLLESLSPEPETLHGLPVQVETLWQTADLLRRSVPLEEATGPVSVETLETSAIIFRP